MYKFLVSGLLMTVLSVVAFESFGQAANSPFTSRGIGDLFDPALAHNQGMGGLGISNGSFWYLNNLNPALLPYNSITVFSAGLVGESRTISNDAISESNSGGNINYLATAFPIKPGKWTTSVGISPYSNVDYSFTTRSFVSGTTTEVDITEEGRGGFTQLNWSHGYAFNKNLAIGVKGTYLFSSIETDFKNELVATDSTLIGISFTPTVEERIAVSDFLFSGGIAYRKDSIFGSKIKMGLGLTYDFQGDIKAERFKVFQNQTNGQSISEDTLFNETRGSVYIPEALGAGISFSNGLIWTAGFDIKIQKWSDFRNFDGNNENLGNGMKLVLGGEFTPDPYSVNRYLKRVTYRIGLTYEDLPYVINGNQINDLGINFGWSLPVGRYSSLDMAFKFGKRGNIDEVGIDENYFRIHLGITFKDPNWFVRSKFD